VVFILYELYHLYVFKINIYFKYKIGKVEKKFINRNLKIFNMLNLFNLFKKYYKYFIYLFIYLLFLGFLNILFSNEELLICIALIIYFTVIISILRKLILFFFYQESELLYILFSLVIGLNILYIQTIFRYLNYIYNYNSFLKNIKTYFILSLFIRKFKLLFFYYILEIKKFFDNFNYRYNYNFSFLLDYTDYLYIKHINKYICLYRKNIRYILVKSTWFFSKMCLISSNNINTTLNYVS
jgi:hypothetical protein